MMAFPKSAGHQWKIIIAESDPEGGLADEDEGCTSRTGLRGSVTKPESL
jgi:hypothetical protein